MAEMSLDARMNRLIGQLEGIRRMIKGKRRTDDVVQQIMAAEQALSRIGILLLKEELLQTVARKARGGATASKKTPDIQTLSGIALKQSDMDSRAAKDVEKILEKLFKI